MNKAADNYRARQFPFSVVAKLELLHHKKKYLPPYRLALAPFSAF